MSATEKEEKKAAVAAVSEESEEEEDSGESDVESPDFGALTKKEEPKPETSTTAVDEVAPPATKGKGAKYPVRGGALGAKHLSKVRDLQRARHSSTNTLYIKSTLRVPDYDNLMNCVAKMILCHIKAGDFMSSGAKKDIFNEGVHPISLSSDWRATRSPTVTDVSTFINKIFKAQKLAHECLIMCLTYVDRVLVNKKTKIVLHTQNWRRIVLSSLVIASKVWEDLAVWNVDFLELFPGMTNVDLNNLEREFLKLLNFDVVVDAGTYAKYYFDLREHTNLKEKFPLKPLDKDGAAKLAIGGKRARKSMIRWQSMSGDYRTHARPATLDGV